MVHKIIVNSTARSVDLEKLLLVAPRFSSVIAKYLRASFLDEGLFPVCKQDWQTQVATVSTIYLDDWWPRVKNDSIAQACLRH